MVSPAKLCALTLTAVLTGCVGPSPEIIPLQTGTLSQPGSPPRTASVLIDTGGTFSLCVRDESLPLGTPLGTCDLTLLGTTLHDLPADATGPGLPHDVVIGSAALRRAGGLSWTRDASNPAPHGRVTLAPAALGTPDGVHTVPLERFPQSRTVTTQPMRTIEEREAWLARHNVQPQTPFAPFDPAAPPASFKLIAVVEMLTDCPVVLVEIDGRHLRAVLDTGSSSPLLVLHWQATGQEPAATWEPLSAVSWEGPRTYAIAPDPVALTIGGHTMTLPAAYTLDPDKWLWFPFDVVIGWPVLSQWSWSIDFAEGVFRFVP